MYVYIHTYIIYIYTRTYLIITVNIILLLILHYYACAPATSRPAGPGLCLAGLGARAADINII